MTFGPADLAFLDAVMREAGRHCIMPRFRKLPPGAIRAKSGPLDLVTEADLAAEATITAALLARFPGAVVVGEEAAAADPAWPARLAGAALAFVVDPIDGTGNYVAGLPLFGVICAAVIGGQVVAACIHDPVTDDSALALAGRGAWAVDRDGASRPLAVAPPATPAAMTGTLSWRMLPDPHRDAALNGASALAGAWDFRCAAHHYRLLAEGRCHYSLYHRLLPWDHAAGWLLHREAGGYAARLDATPYSPLETTGGLLCAPDQPSWRALRQTFFGTG